MGQYLAPNAGFGPHLSASENENDPAMEHLANGSGFPGCSGHVTRTRTMMLTSCPAYTGSLVKFYAYTAYYLVSGLSMAVNDTGF